GLLALLLLRRLTRRAGRRHADHRAEDAIADGLELRAASAAAPHLDHGPVVTHRPTRSAGQGRRLRVLPAALEAPLLCHSPQVVGGDRSLACCCPVRAHLSLAPGIVGNTGCRTGGPRLRIDPSPGPTTSGGQHPRPEGIAARWLGRYRSGRRGRG